MFIVPFLKYFRPYLFRLSSAVFCMFLIGGLAAVPILIAMEAVDVLSRGTNQQAATATGAGDLQALAMFAQGKTSGENGDTDANPIDTLKEKILTSLEAFAGDAYTAPRDWAIVQADRFNAWYDGLPPMRTLAFLVAALIILTAIKGASEFYAKYQLSYTFFLTNLKIREDIFKNILGQDYLFFNKHQIGYLHSRINSDVKAVRDVIEAMLSDGIQHPITILSMFCVLLFISVQLTLGVMLVVPVIAGLLYYFARVLRKNTRKQKKKADELSSTLTESLANIRLVKAFGTEEYETAKFNSRSMALFRYMMAQRMAKFGSSPLMEFLGSVVAAGVIMFGGWMILKPNATMEFKDFFGYLFALTRFYRPIRSLAQIVNKYQVARVSGERMTEMLRLEPKLINVKDPKPFAKLCSGIELNDISFCYSDEKVIDGISLHVRAGQSVAFAGPSGSGKTTLVNMLARLIDPGEGAILIDGVDLRQYSLDDWRCHLAIVTQDTYLFDDSVAANIAYGSDTVDMDRVRDAARAANAHEFILDLDGGKGYQTVIGPCGSRLSGGQRQRLAIARAIYRDPEILILDEATSALDSNSQAVVQDALNRLMVGRTTFIIAHRISTIRHVDCIYVIDQGRICEQGSHDELIAMGGLYAQMVNHAGMSDKLGESPQPTPLLDNSAMENL